MPHDIIDNRNAKFVNHLNGILGTAPGYLRTLGEYVHLNPVRAKLLRPDAPLREGAPGGRRTKGRTDHPGRTCQSGLAGSGFIPTTQARSAETALGGPIAMALLLAASAATSAPAAEPSPKLAPGITFTIAFPELPPTFADLLDHNHVKPQMTVFLPRNYDPDRKHPLLIFLNGGNGGAGGNPGVARRLAEEKDFICVGLPLFKEKVDPPAPGNAPARRLIRNPDCKFAWPLYKPMLAKLEESVPNIDPAHRILGGFSNGAHATSGLIDESDGEVARRFSAFFFVEGGGKLQRYDLLKGKPFLMAYGSEKSHPRAQQIYEAAKAAGAKATLHGMNNVGHAFPESEFPAVREWFRKVQPQASPLPLSKPRYRVGFPPFLP
jgi:dienelactone hydrolase